MEAASGVPNGRVVSLSSSSSSSPSVRKEWRIISEQQQQQQQQQQQHHPSRNSSNEGQTDERTIYEVQQGIEVDYCSITVDDDLMQQRLHEVATQRERMQQMEIEMRAQMISRQQVMEMQNTFSEQINEQVIVAAKLKEHLHEREQAIRDLELKMEEKDRELHAITLDNKAAWANEDRIREQDKELLAYRREHENLEAERAQQLQQMHDLKEHFQEKERQYLELEEQHRVLQETILYKDEQLREAQAWVTRMDAMQSTTNHSLQTELRERTEQFNHFWLGCQRQFADMERHHLQAIQQLQLELTEARQRSGGYTNEASMEHANSEDNSSFGQTKGTQFNVNEDGTLSGNRGAVPNGNVDDYHTFAASGNASIKTEHVPGVPFQSSVLGLGAYLPPPGHALHPFFIPQQGLPHSVPPTNPHVHESHIGHFVPMPAISSHQEWQQQQAVADGSQLPNPIQYQPSQNEHISSGHYDYAQSADGHISQSGYVVDNIVPNQEAGSVITVSREEAESLVYTQPPQNQENLPHFHEELMSDSDKMIETKLKAPDMMVPEEASEILKSKEGQGVITEKQSSAVAASVSSTPVPSSEPQATTECNGSTVVIPEASISSGRTLNILPQGKVPEHKMMDERSLLACIVRAIPAGSGGQIRISSTLPNRLGKMLAPLHWHDYKKKYGKLDDFVGAHPELFVIEGDFIQLRDGAQEMISATAAIAKVAAAAAASGPLSSVLPSVAVTPMAQNHRLKKVPSIDYKTVKVGSSDVVMPPAVSVDKSSQKSVMQNQHPNGAYKGLTNVNFLSKPRHQQELNGMQSEGRSGQSSVHMAVGNGANLDGDRVATHQNKGTTNGRQGMNLGGKQQRRDNGAAVISRR